MSVQKFTWNRIKERAAAQVADGKLNDEEIAKRAGITRQGLVKWKANAEFQERVSQIITATRTAILTQGIADRVNRVAGYNDRRERLNLIISERAEAMSGECSGGSSGLLVHTTKQIGGGENARSIDEYAVDTGLLRELRELEKQAAIEVGDWVEKRDIKTDAKDNLKKSNKVIAQ